MRILLPAALAVLALAGCERRDDPPSDTAGAAAALPPPARTEAPAGSYVLDKGHASLTFRVSHLGLSRYTARFTGMDARLAFDPARPEASLVTAEIDARSLETDYPDPAVDFDGQLQGPEWLDAARHPTIFFRSTRIERTGADTARVTGELTLRGVTGLVTLATKFNGGYASGPADPMGSRIGFSARGTLRRSDFGMVVGIPAPGSNFGVGDEVEVLIESEFVRPATAPAAPPPGG